MEMRLNRIATVFLKQQCCGTRHSPNGGGVSYGEEIPTTTRGNRGKVVRGEDGVRGKMV